MKKVITLCLLMISFSSIYSQVTLDFCASVESNGYCNFNNTKFIAQLDSTTGRIFMEVKSKDQSPINANVVIFKIYSVDKAGNEKFVNILQQNIKPDWLYAWMPNVFTAPGKFNVKVYNENDTLLCSKMFELISFK